jgi:hypothetical protein
MKFDKKPQFIISLIHLIELADFPKLNSFIFRFNFFPCSLEKTKTKHSANLGRTLKKLQIILYK